MSIGQKIRRSVRVNFYADPRFSPTVAGKDIRRALAARALVRDPYPVIYTCSMDYAPIGIGNHIGHALRAQPIIFLLFLPWTMERTKRTHRIATAIQVYENRRPNHRVLVLCNTEAEQAIFEAEGVSALFCNQNALRFKSSFALIGSYQNKRFPLTKKL